MTAGTTARAILLALMAMDGAACDVPEESPRSAPRSPQDGGDARPRPGGDGGTAGTGSEGEDPARDAGGAPLAGAGGYSNADRYSNANFPACAPDAGKVDQGGTSPSSADVGDASSLDGALDTGADADARDVPPPQCVPPCIWEHARDCRPLGPCQRVETPDGRFAECAPENDWVAFGLDGRALVEGVNRTPCFSVDLGLATVLPSTPRESWLDGTTGEVIATAYGLGSTYITCVDSGEHYDVTPEAPDCAPWAHLGIAGISPHEDCQPGCCPPPPWF